MLNNISMIDSEQHMIDSLQYHFCKLILTDIYEKYFSLVKYLFEIEMAHEIESAPFGQLYKIWKQYR